MVFWQFCPICTQTQWHEVKSELADKYFGSYMDNPEFVNFASFYNLDRIASWVSPDVTKILQN